MALAANGPPGSARRTQGAGPVTGRRWRLPLPDVPPADGHCPTLVAR